MLIAQEWNNGVKSVSVQTGADGQYQLLGSKSHQTVLTSLKAAFLPSGYPQSVTQDYIGFQLWDTIQALSSYIRGMLSSQAILVGVGVGQEAATPLGAVFQFFIRDLAGMLGGIVFATAQGNQLDSYAKQWRIFADCLNNVGMAIELASPLVPSAFLLLACLGSIARAVTGVAGGATRAALTQHFARQRNAADIAAKEGSQETATTMVGMVLGMGLIRATAGWQAGAWAAFLVLTWIHVYANIRALRCLHMTSLNRPRLDILLAHFWREGRVLTPTDMACRESLLAPPLRSLASWAHLIPKDPAISIAPTLSSLDLEIQQQVGRSLKALAEQDGLTKHLVLLRASKGSGTLGPALQEAKAGSANRELHEAPGGGLQQEFPPQSGPAAKKALVLLRLGSTVQDVLLAYCSAWLQVSVCDVRVTQTACKLAMKGQENVAAADATGEHQGLAGRGSCQTEQIGSVGGPEGGYAWSACVLPPEDDQRLMEFVRRLESAGWLCDRISLLQGESRLAWGRDIKTE